MSMRTVASAIMLATLGLAGCTTDTLPVPEDEIVNTGDDPTADSDETDTDAGDAGTGDDTAGGDDSTDGDPAGGDGTSADDDDVDPVASRVLYVDATAGGVADGSTWAHAFTRVQDALAAAKATEQIRVGQGTYRPADTVDRDATFTMVSGVQLLGGYAGLSEADPDAHDIDRYATILDGDLLGDDDAASTNTTDNARHVVTVTGDVASGLLDGFTVTGGYADGTSSDTTGQGGGLHNAGADFEFRNCRIIGNYATVGGGVRNSGGTLALVSCTVQDNAAQLTGGGVYAAGGLLTMVNTQLLRNHAPNGGGGLFSVAGKTNLHNVTLVGNTTDFDGGGLYVQDGAIEATNVALTANQVNRNGGGIFLLGGACTLTNCIVWANLGGNGTSLDAQIASAAGTVTATYSCIGDEDAADASIPFGGLASRNLDDDPRFLIAPGPGGDGRWDGMDDDFGDLGLWPDSPCIDAGDTAALPADSADADGDEVTDETLPIDMAGNTRVKSVEVDLGPHEF